MRAIAIAEDRSLVPVELEAPEPGPGEVRVDVAFCGICGSDLHFRASEAIPPGTVMGHELSGRVGAVGEGVEGWRAGDRVCVFPFAPCGACPMCRAGNEHLCAEAATTGLGMGPRHGAYAESLAVRADMLFRLPEELSDEHGALVEPLAVALHGIALAEARPEEPAVVIGAGPIGVMTALALRAKGFERVLVIERNEARRSRIEELGIASLGLEEVHMRMLESFGNTLPPVVLECAGNVAAPQLALELVAPGGCVVALGVLEEPVSISQLLLILKEARLRGSFAYRRADFAEAIELLAEGGLPADRLVTSVVELERTGEMFEELARPGTEQLKVLVRP